MIRRSSHMDPARIEFATLNTKIEMNIMRKE